MKIEDRALSEKISQLKKGIEILGGIELLKEQNDSILLNQILEKVFTSDKIDFTINNNDYTISEILKNKQAFEIYFLKNKLTTINAIVYKIKKYDTSLDSLIRKYKKSRSLEEYNKIYSTVSKSYRLDINKLILKDIQEEIYNNLSLDEQDAYCGEYLNQKKKQIIDSVISKMGIV